MSNLSLLDGVRQSSSFSIRIACAPLTGKLFISKSIRACQNYKTDLIKITKIGCTRCGALDVSEIHVPNVHNPGSWQLPADLDLVCTACQTRLSYFKALQTFVCSYLQSPPPQGERINYFKSNNCFKALNTNVSVNNDITPKCNRRCSLMVPDWYFIAFTRILLLSYTFRILIIKFSTR